MTRFCLNDLAEAGMKKAILAVEATDFERRTLVGESTLVTLYDHGGMVTVGSIHIEGEEWPVTLSVNFARTTDEKVIMFYEATSRIVDYDQVSKWLDEQGFTRPDCRCGADDLPSRLRRMACVVGGVIPLGRPELVEVPDV